MKKILMSLFVVLASWTLIPANASALPRSCDQVCSCSTPCITRCTLGPGGPVASCGFMEYCSGMCADDPTEETSAMDTEEASAIDLVEYSEEGLVCRVLES